MQKPLAIESRPEPAELDSPQWRAARARLRQYVLALQLPEAEARRLLDTALAQARAADPVMPLPAAVAALTRLSARDPAIAAIPVSMPVAARGGMRPERIERGALRLLVSGLLRPLAVAIAGPAQTRRRRLVLTFFTIVTGLSLPPVG